MYHFWGESLGYFFGRVWITCESSMDNKLADDEVVLIVVEYTPVDVDF